MPSIKPCGGIYPISRKIVCNPESNYLCFVCGKFDPFPDHYCEEWECFLHGDCIEPFLKTYEGGVVLDHKHDVIIRKSDGTLFLIKNKHEKT